MSEGATTKFHFISCRSVRMTLYKIMGWINC